MKRPLAVVIGFLASFCLSSCVDLEVYTYYDDMTGPSTVLPVFFHCEDAQGLEFEGQALPALPMISNHYLMAAPFEMPYFCEINNIECCSDLTIPPEAMNTSIQIYLGCAKYNTCDGVPGNGP